MDKKKYNIMWWLSLAFIAVVTLVWAISRISGAELPDMAVRILGILELICIPVFVYATKKKQEK